jgi:hypothetical protein
MLGWISLLIGAIVVLVVAWQIKTGRHPILSARNFFLAGFMIYQITSAAIAFFSGVYWELSLQSPAGTGALYLGWVVIFLLVMHFVYEWKWFTFSIPKKLAKPDPLPAPITMMTLAVGFLIVGYVFRLTFQFIPVIGVLGTMVGVTLATAAAGMACWVWAKQIFNPARASFAFAIVGLATALALLRTFGRRDLVSVAVVCLWGAFHGHFKKQNLGRMFLPLTGVALAGLIVISAYTSVRTHESRERGFVDQMMSLLQADVVHGMVDVFSGQGAAPISMWLMESRPENFPYDTLHSLRYVTTNIIPREWWPNKLESLGITMVPEAAIVNKASGFTVGPGMMGHIANDNPWLALLLYAALMGAFLRILDEMVRLEPDNPFVVIPVGVALGEIVAIPRGELGLFVFRTIIAIVSAYIGMRMVAKLLVAFGMRYNVALAGADGESRDGVRPPDYHDHDEGDWHGGSGGGHGAAPADGAANAAGAAPAPQRVPWGLQGS